MADKKPEHRKKTEPKKAHHGRSRREFIKKLAVGGSAAAAATAALPKKWAKPVVDAVIVPVHAQSSAVGTITPRWILGDDGPGGLAGIGAGTTNQGNDNLYDDGTDMFFKATLSPAAAVLVTVNVNRSGTTYGGNDFGPSTATANAISGIATFGTFEPPNDDFGDAPGSGSITVTFSAPGYANSVITLTLSS